MHATILIRLQTFIVLTLNFDFYNESLISICCKIRQNIVFILLLCTSVFSIGPRDHQLIKKKQTNYNIDLSLTSSVAQSIIIM